LVLFAPLKQYIYVEGDFNDWQLSSRYLMNVTPDKQRFWVRITGLKAGTEYAYQYLIDGSLKVADYNCEKILDPDNDKYIPVFNLSKSKTISNREDNGYCKCIADSKACVHVAGK
jgi:hypothetical protein